MELRGLFPLHQQVVLERIDRERTRPRPRAGFPHGGEAGFDDHDPGAVS